MIRYNLPLIMVRCLLLTILIETVFAFILGIRKKKDYINIILVNVLTNPLVASLTFACNIFCGLNARNVLEMILEILVVITEGIVYYKYFNYKKINPFIVAILLNMMSYGLGIVLNSILY